MENVVLGCASFYDYPNVDNIDCSEQWNEFAMLKGYEMANSLNCLFMHYFTSQDGKESSVLKEIISTVLSTSPDIHFIIVNISGDKSLELFSDHFKLIHSVRGPFHWYGIQRDTLMPRLHIRPARPEDQDDLAPIFNEKTDILRKLYGEFFIAEMIEAQSDDLKCFVAEVAGIGIGFMSVSTTMNIQLIHDSFFVEPFNGFMKPISSDDEETKKTSSTENEEEFKPPSNEHSVILALSGSVIESDLTTTSTLKLTDIIGNFNLIPTKTKTGNSQKKEFIPKFRGKPSALVIQMFAIKDIFEIRSFDFVNEVFKVFPEKDYLLITIPHLVPEFILLENFIRITPIPGIILPHELYVFHKGCLIGDFTVRVACKQDLDSIAVLIENLRLSDNILEDLHQFYDARRYDDGVNLHAFVAESLDQIVGIAILQDEEDIEFIRSHYNIEDFIYFNHHRRQEHARIKHFALSPVFKRLSKGFIKEVMRKAHKSSLYFPVYKRWASKKFLKGYSLPTIIHELVAIRPRKQIIYDVKTLGINAPTGRILQIQEGFCLMHINKKLIMEPKLTINARIVVIGASTTGLSFLEYLVFSPHLKFNNLFLVSTHGLPDNYTDNDHIEQLMGKDFYFSKKKLELSALRIQVSVVKGKMTAINRKTKLITIDDTYLLPYDHMIITTGLQFTIPCPTEMNEVAQNKNFPLKKEPTNTPERRYSELVFKNRTDKSKPMEKRMPQNMLIVNDPFDALDFLGFVQTHMFNDESNIIIYGYCFETFCCLHTLLNVGIAGYRIHLIKPPFDETFPINDPVVERAVYNALSEGRISIHSNYTLSHYNHSKDVPAWITSATFTSDYGPTIYLDCKMFISYYKRVVNYNAFRAINDSCLVFDARLVIDSFFHTNDVSIRAAGPVTKFKRRYYSDEWNHSKFSSKIVGEKLAQVFLQLFDPTLEPTITPPKIDIPLIPIYLDPILKGCILPGGFNYFSVTKPRLEMPLTTMMEKANYGSVFVTGDPYSDQGYFRLHLDQYMKVESITCLRKKSFPMDNYIQLYMIHERALNNFQSRFNEGLIKDLYEFFDESWTTAIYHDRFKDLKEELSELLISEPTESICKISIEDTIRKMMSTGLELSEDQKKALVDEYQRSGTKTAIEKRLINFITYNYYHLPMYAKPDII